MIYNDRLLVRAAPVSYLSASISTTALIASVCLVERRR
jgi:hypothetical protein